MDILETTVIVIIGFFLGIVFLGIFLQKKKTNSAFEAAQKESQKILQKAQDEADRIIKSSLQEAKEEAKKRRKALEEEYKKKRADSNKIEQKLKQREQAYQDRHLKIEKKEQKFLEKEQKLNRDEKKLLRLVAEQELALEKSQKNLEKIANMSIDQAKQELLDSLRAQAEKEAKLEIRRIEEDINKTTQKKTQEIISLAIQRQAGDYVNDSTITVVQLPSEEMKGRIIGREGRNIRAIEQATGVDLIIDDTPEAVIISCFNPVRREIAKIAVEKLVADGRIHPARIQETVEKVESEFNMTIREYGEHAALDMGVTNLSGELIELLGKLRFRSLGGQSVLQHSVETAHICGMMAAELGLDIKQAKRAAFLHDIGKALGEEIEGHHATLGADVCEKNGESREIVEAIRQHHSTDIIEPSPLANILSAANLLSASRPGSKKEVLGNYIKRLESMEKMVKETGDIKTAHVLQAGREIRVLLEPTEHSDKDVVDLSYEISARLRKEMSFPGQIKITVIKENQHVEFAT